MLEDLKKRHHYYNQINLYQGILNIKIAFFVVYACGGVIIREIAFDEDFFQDQINN